MGVKEIKDLINKTLKYEAAVLPEEYSSEYVYKTGIPPLDDVLGGFPSGKIYEIAGLEGTGKSTLLLHIIKYIQNTYPEAIIVYFDAENSFYRERAEQLGVNINNIILTYPNYIEDVFQTIKDILSKSDEQVIFFLDSITSLPSYIEEDSGYYKQDMGLHARAVSKAFRLTINILREKQGTLFIVNQLRQNIKPFGKQYITTGGKAIDFYTTITLMLTIKERIKEGEEVKGTVVIAKAEKNKLAPPHKPVYLIYHYKQGFNIKYTLLRYLIDNKLLQYKNGWINYNNKKYRMKDFIEQFNLEEIYYETKEENNKE